MWRKPETSVKSPPSKNLETMTMEAVAPSTCDFKEVVEDLLAISLREDNYVRNSGAIKQELDEQRMEWVGKFKDSLT